MLEGLSFYGAYLEAKKMAGEQSFNGLAEDHAQCRDCCGVGGGLCGDAGADICVSWRCHWLWVTGEPLYDAFGSMVIGGLAHHCRGRVGCQASGALSRPVSRAGLTAVGRSHHCGKAGRCAIALQYGDVAHGTKGVVGGQN